MIQGVSRQAFEGFLFAGVLSDFMSLRVVAGFRNGFEISATFQIGFTRGLQGVSKHYIAFQGVLKDFLEGLKGFYDRWQFWEFGSGFRCLQLAFKRVSFNYLSSLTVL